jgi:hypothetical protein
LVEDTTNNLGNCREGERSYSMSEFEATVEEISENTEDISIAGKKIQLK